MIVVAVLSNVLILTGVIAIPVYAVRQARRTRRMAVARTRHPAELARVGVGPVPLDSSGPEIRVRIPREQLAPHAPVTSDENAAFHAIVRAAATQAALREHRKVMIRFFLDHCR